jgi:hypothetical protein
VSRLTIRIVLITLIGVAIVFGVFMTVQAAASSGGNSLGMYVLGGGLVNPLHSQPAAVEASGEIQSQGVSSYSGEKEGGHGCDSEAYEDPNDY